jgi:hypothetical protein
MRRPTGKREITVMKKSGTTIMMLRCVLSMVVPMKYVDAICDPA